MIGGGVCRCIIVEDSRSKLFPQNTSACKIANCYFQAQDFFQAARQGFLPAGAPFEIAYECFSRGITGQTSPNIWKKLRGNLGSLEYIGTHCISSPALL
jgi:hypothetical protein